MPKALERRAMAEVGDRNGDAGEEPKPSSSPTTEEYLAALGPEERQVAELLENVRRKLLDISGNNRFLSFRETAKSLRFNTSDPDSIYQLLVEDGGRVEIVAQSCHRPSLRAMHELEEVVIHARLALYNRDMPCGPRALRKHLEESLAVEPLPSERSIARMLARNGLTHGRTGLYPGDVPNR